MIESENVETVRADSVAVPPDSFVTIDIDEITAAGNDRSAGQRLEDALQNRYAGHKLMGSDGLAEIVTLQLSRTEALGFESMLQQGFDVFRGSRKNSPVAT